LKEPQPQSISVIDSFVNLNGQKYTMKREFDHQIKRNLKYESYVDRPHQIRILVEKSRKKFKLSFEVIPSEYHVF